MNRILLISFLIFSIFSKGQIQEIAKLADGDLVYTTILSNSKGELFGYIYFFDQGKIDTDNHQFEYVLLDKNLNEDSNGTYTEKLIEKANVQFYDSTLIGDEISLSDVVNIKYVILLSFNRIISFND